MEVGKPILNERASLLSGFVCLTSLDENKIIYFVRAICIFISKNCEIKKDLLNTLWSQQSEKD